LLTPNGPERERGRPWRAGDLFVVPRSTRWDVINDPAPDGHYRALVVVPGPDEIAAFAARPEAAPTRPVRDAVHLRCDDDFAEAMARVARSLDTGAGVSPAVQRHRLHELLLLLAERGWRFGAGQARGWADQVRGVIAHRPQADWTIDALAQVFSTSASTLRRRLADEGQAAGELVREVRLETALALLQTTALPIGEIAARCGYESHSRFSAAFKARFGLAPTEMRPVSASAQELTLSG
jgi:AraC-like DNA-binding protein